MTPHPKKLTKADRAEFQQLDKKVRDGAAAFMEIGKALQEIHKRTLWKASDHDTWESYCREVLGMSPPQAHRIVKGSQIALELAESLPIGNDSPPMHPVSESQVRPLAKIEDPEARKSIWMHSVEEAGGQPTAKTVAARVAEHMDKNQKPPPAPGESNTADDGEVDEKSIEVEVEAELITASPDAKDANEDTTLSAQDEEKVDEEQAPAPNNYSIKKWCIMISQIRGEARGECDADKIISLANELEADMKSTL